MSSEGLICRVGSRSMEAEDIMQLVPNSEAKRAEVGVKQMDTTYIVWHIQELLLSLPVSAAGSK